jgi:hypothetical protein
MARHHSPGTHRERRLQSPDGATPPRLVVDDRARRTPKEARDNASGGRVDRRSKRDGNVARKSSVANASAEVIRKSTYEQRRRMSKCLALGMIDDEVSLIAKRVQQLACTSEIVAWVHAGRIFAAPADSAAKVPPAATIGIYGTGVLLAEIEDDILRLRERPA